MSRGRPQDEPRAVPTKAQSLHCFAGWTLRGSRRHPPGSVPESQARTLGAQIQDQGTLRNRHRLPCFGITGADFIATVKRERREEKLQDTCQVEFEYCVNHAWDGGSNLQETSAPPEPSLLV